MFYIVHNLYLKVHTTHRLLAAIIQNFHTLTKLSQIDKNYILLEVYLYKILSK